MKRRAFLLAPLALAATAAPKPVLDRESFRHYVDQFNRDDKEDVAGLIHNADAWAWMKNNVPFFSCPDPDIELRTTIAGGRFASTSRRRAPGTS